MSLVKFYPEKENFVVFHNLSNHSEINWDSFNLKEAFPMGAPEQYFLEVFLCEWLSPGTQMLNVNFIWVIIWQLQFHYYNVDPQSQLIRETSSSFFINYYLIDQKLFKRKNVTFYWLDIHNSSFFLR